MPTILFVLGVALLAAGVAMWSLPAAAVTVGLVLIVVAVLFERGTRDAGAGAAS